MSELNDTLKDFLTEETANELQEFLDLLGQDLPDAEQKLAARLAVIEESEAA